MPSEDVIKSKLGAMSVYMPELLPLALAEAMSGSVALRNRLVHGYEKVQRKTMMDDIAGGIGQYVEYMKHITAYIEKESGGK